VRAGGSNRAFRLSFDRAVNARNVFWKGIHLLMLLHFTFRFNDLVIIWIAAVRIRGKYGFALDRFFARIATESVCDIQSLADIGKDGNGRSMDRGAVEGGRDAHST
jgi:hypothetical protein